MVLTYHSALNSVRRIVRDLHSMLANSEEHGAVFPQHLSKCQVCKTMSNSDSFYSMLLIRRIRLIFRLTVSRLMLSICWIVLYVVFNMWVAQARLLG